MMTTISSARKALFESTTFDADQTLDKLQRKGGHIIMQSPVTGCVVVAMPNRTWLRVNSRGQISLYSK